MTFSGGDREHIVQLSRSDKQELLNWLTNIQSGGFYRSRLGVEAVEGGGLLIRTKPFGSN